MERFLVHQIYYIKEVISNDTNVAVGVNVRNIGAENEETAIGKFVKNVDFPPKSVKLDLIAFPLKGLIKID